MKKLSLLLAAALCVTIGGVYATWNYAQKTATSVESKLSAQLELTADAEKGSIAVDANNLTLVIDDIGAADYVAELVFSASLSVSFTPAVGADEVVAQQGVPLQITITENFGTYDHDGDGNADFDLFYIGEEGQTSATFDLNGGAPVIGTIDVNLSDYIKMTALSLPTKSHYDRLNSLLNTEGNNFVITISEKI